MTATQGDPFFGIPVIMSSALPDGQIVLASDGTFASSLVMAIGTCPLTELQQAGRDARLTVRRGLADVLAWLGQEVENEPTGVQIIGRLKARW